MIPCSGRWSVSQKSRANEWRNARSPSNPKCGIASGTSSNRNRYLEIGCIILGMGVGLGFSAIFTVLDLSEDTMDLLIYGTIMMFGGLGLVGAHYIRQRGG